MHENTGKRWSLKKTEQQGKFHSGVRLRSLTESAVQEVMPCKKHGKQIQTSIAGSLEEESIRILRM